MYIISTKDFFQNKDIRLTPLEKDDNVEYDTDVRFSCCLNKSELDEIKLHTVPKEKINTQLDKGRFLYVLEDKTEELIQNGWNNHDYWYYIDIQIFDIYSPNTVRIFNLDFLSEKYQANIISETTSEIIKYITERTHNVFPKGSRYATSFGENGIVHSPARADDLYIEASKWIPYK